MEFLIAMRLLLENPKEADSADSKKRVEEKVNLYLKSKDVIGNFWQSAQARGVDAGGRGSQPKTGPRTINVTHPPLKKESHTQPTQYDLD